MKKRSGSAFRWPDPGIPDPPQTEGAMDPDCSMPKSAGSANLYSYVQGDPVNYGDPDGLQRCGDIQIDGGPFRGQTLSQAMSGTNGNSLLVQLVYHEAGTIFQSDINNPEGYYTDLTGVGTAILNQWDVDNGRMKVYQGATAVCPLGSCASRSLAEVIIAIAKDNIGSLFDSTGHMRAADRAKLDAVLNTDVASGPQIRDASGRSINIDCEGMVTSFSVGEALLTGALERYRPNGLTLLFWNRADASSITTFPGSAGYTGIRDSRQQGQTFWGLTDVPSAPKRRATPTKGRL